ncbi:MAG: serine/threonine-protein kinase, partial [Myxococcales bacterium]
MGELYAEDIVAEQQERNVVLAEARALLRGPADKRSAADKNDRTASKPLSAVTMPVVPATALAPAAAPARLLPPAPGVAAARPPAPPAGGRTGRETLVGGPIDHARGRHDARRDDGLSISFSDGDSNSGPEEPSHSTVVGSLVSGRYRVRRLRGEGGMGRVYEAEHIEIGKRVALKILHPGYSQTPDLVERLRREARAASRIGHPNVVDVTDSGTTDDGAFFFVMEYLEGRELGEIIFEEKGLDLRRALGITAQICRALQAAHKAGVIHRDLKPENVLLVERDGQKDFVKVLDFGIAKNLTDQDDEPNGNPRRKLTNPGVAMGTPEYMAPEQAAGRPADVRSDVYAVGGLLYEMLSGRAAYEGSNFMEILHKKANQAPAPISTFRPDIPPEIEDLVKRTMATDPAARPQSMEEFERELTEIAWQVLPPIFQDRVLTGGPPGSPNANPVLSDTPRPVVLHGARGAALWSGGGRASVAALWERVSTDRRRLSALGAAGFLMISLVVYGISRSRANLEHAGSETAEAVFPPMRSGNSGA